MKPKLTGLERETWELYKFLYRDTLSYTNDTDGALALKRNYPKIWNDFARLARRVRRRVAKAEHLAWGRGYSEGYNEGY